MRLPGAGRPVTTFGPVETRTASVLGSASPSQDQAAVRVERPEVEGNKRSTFACYRRRSGWNAWGQFEPGLALPGPAVGNLNLGDGARHVQTYTTAGARLMAPVSAPYDHTRQP